MKHDTLFCNISSADLANLIKSASGYVCFVGPGLQQITADAIVESSRRLGAEMITVCIDPDERVLRMGYGDLQAIKALMRAGVVINRAPGLRSGLIIVDDEGYSYTPNALLLEAELREEFSFNALRLSLEQVNEALARLSPVAKSIAVAKASTPEEKERIKALPVEVGTSIVGDSEIEAVGKRLEQAPPVNFDLARQVRVYNAYLQYIEITLTGAAIQRRRVPIPQSIQKIGGGEEIEHRLRTTFDLIEKDSKLSSKSLEDALNEIRSNFTRSLGKEHGRVVLKNAKPVLIERLEDLRTRLESHQKAIEEKLQEYLDSSREVVIEYYLPQIAANLPDGLIGQTGSNPSDELVRRWLDRELRSVFPSAIDLLQEMKLEWRFKDVTFETLNAADFLRAIRKAFPDIDWDRAYDEFKAAGESTAFSAL